MSFGFLEDWHGILPREGGHVVTLRGGDGKTALIEAMSTVLVAAGVPVAVARDGADGPLAWPGLIRCPLDALHFEHHLLHVVAADGGTGGVTPEQADELGGALPDHVLFYEIDSGTNRPAMISAAGALPKRTSLLITVCGLDAIGQPAATLFADTDRIPNAWLTEMDGQRVWSWDGLVAWFASLPDGSTATGAPAPQVAALLMMDECLDSIGLFTCLGRLMDEHGLSLVMMGDTSGPAPRLRTAFTEADR